LALTMRLFNPQSDGAQDRATVKRTKYSVS
jgi:hypothetical protein